MRRITDEYNPGYKYAVWLEANRQGINITDWFRQVRPRGRYKIERTEVLFDLEEDAVMFEMAIC